MKKNDGSQENMSTTYYCTICQQEIHSAMIGDGDGSLKDSGRFAHDHCWYRREYEKLKAADECRKGNHCPPHQPGPSASARARELSRELSEANEAVLSAQARRDSTKKQLETAEAQARVEEMELQARLWCHVLHDSPLQSAVNRPYGRRDQRGEEVFTFVTKGGARAQLIVTRDHPGSKPD